MTTRIPICPVCGDKAKSDCPYCLLQLGLRDSQRPPSRISGNEAEVESEPTGESLVRDGVLTQFGDYELLSEIARGGMGAVYRARQKSLNRLVAVKLILAGQLATPESLQRFRLEAEAAALLDHPAIVPVYEIGEFETQHFFSMKLIEGVSLAECLEDFAVSPIAIPAARREQEQFVAELVIRVARALDFAHRHGVLHRDLKPSNIIIDQEGLPHLTDFGLAKLTGRASSGLTLSHAVLGTPGYLAPEQAAGNENVTTATDVYGLGATLYELLVGRPPFSGANALETMAMAIQQDPLPPRRLNPSLHRDLETIALRCLQKQPEKRLSSAGMVADELERFLRREPILARPIGHLERASRWCQRHPGVSALAVALMFAIVVGSVVATWQWGRAVQANVHLRENVQYLQRDLIDDILSADESSRALAKIAALLHEDPTDWKAAMFGMSIMDQHRFPVPTLPPIRHPDGAELRVARLSPDGKRLVTASVDGSARLWSSLTGELLARPMQHGATVNWAEFSPDGKRLATCSNDRTVCIWDAVSGKQQFPPLSLDEPAVRVHFCSKGEHLLARNTQEVAIYNIKDDELLLGARLQPGRVINARFTENGKNVFTVSSTGDKSQVQVWDLETQTPRIHLETGPLIDADINADLSRVVGLSGERGAIWDTSSGREINDFTSRHGRMVEVRFNAAGDQFATIGFDHWARTWNTASAIPISPELPHFYLVNGLSYVGKGDRLMTWGDDSLVQLWESTTGEVFAEPMKHPNRVMYAEAGKIDDQEVFLATLSHTKFAGRDDATSRGTGAAQLWRVHGKRPLVDRSRGDHYGHDGSMLSADGKLLALGNITEEVWVMKTDTGETVCGPLQVNGAPWGVLFTPDSSRLITTTSRGQVAIWSIPDGKLLFEPHQFATAFQPAEIALDGKHFATGSSDGFIRVWDSQTGRPVWEQQHGSEINSAGFSPDGRLVASAGENWITKVWDVQSGGLVQSLKGHQNEVMRVAFHPDSRQIVTASQDFTARIWDATSGHQQFVLPHQGEVLDANFSPNGQFVATGSRDRTAMIWNATTGVPRNRPLLHHQTVHGVRFSPDSQRLLTVDYFGPRLWDVETGHPLTVRLPHRMHAGDGFQSTPFDPHFTPDGQAFFMSGGSRHALLWRVPVPPKEIPLWFPEFLEAVAGQKFVVGRNTPEFVPPTRFLALRRELEHSTNSDFYTRWALKWLEGY